MKFSALILKGRSVRDVKEEEEGRIKYDVFYEGRRGSVDTRKLHLRERRRTTVKSRSVLSCTENCAVLPLPL